jgi:hypothetical protein
MNLHREVEKSDSDCGHLRKNLNRNLTNTAPTALMPVNTQGGQLVRKLI